MRPTVRFKIAETTLTIARSGSGDLVLTGDRTDNIGNDEVAALTHYIHENLISRGWTLSDEHVHGLAVMESIFTAANEHGVKRHEKGMLKL